MTAEHPTDVAAACDWVERTLARNNDHKNYVALRMVLEAARRSTTHVGEDD